eukprot:3939010-Rhodomonas_salina.2
MRFLCAGWRVRVGTDSSIPGVSTRRCLANANARRDQEPPSHRSSLVKLRRINPGLKLYDARY